MLVAAGATPKASPAEAAGAEPPTEPRLKPDGPDGGAVPPPKLKPPAEGGWPAALEPKTKPEGAAGWLEGAVLGAEVPRPNPPEAAGVCVAPMPPRVSFGAFPPSVKTFPGAAGVPKLKAAGWAWAWAGAARAKRPAGCVLGGGCCCCCCGGCGGAPKVNPPPEGAAEAAEEKEKPAGAGAAPGAVLGVPKVKPPPEAPPPPPPPKLNWFMAREGVRRPGRLSGSASSAALPNRSRRTHR